MSVARILVAVSVATALFASRDLLPRVAPPAPGIGDLPARVVHAHGEFDVFVPSGGHSDCSFKSFAPIALAPQVPLKVSIATDPPAEATGWKIDPDGLIVVRLKDQSGERHLSLTLDVDVLLMESAGHEDVETTSSLFRRPATAALKPYLRALAGADPADPDVAKVAATLKSKAQDLVALARAIDAIARDRVKDGAAGHDAAGEALRHGSGGRLARANVATALFLSQGVPTRMLGVVPARGSGSFEYLVDVNAGDEGWLRLDLLHRAAASFPWSEREDVVLAEVTADTPIAAGSRPRLWFCGGGLTAGTKGASLWLCREVSAANCPRSTAKQIVPVLIAAFNAERGRDRAPADVLDVAASPTATASRPLVEWLATLKPIDAAAAKPADPAGGKR